MDAILGFLLLLIGLFEVNRRRQKRRLQDEKAKTQRLEGEANTREDRAASKRAKDDLDGLLKRYNAPDKPDGSGNGAS